ncbi:sugar transferase [Kocuria rhizophila]|nr:sugar transferase [Kocuria rhizophila]
MDELPQLVKRAARDTAVAGRAPSFPGRVAQLPQHVLSAQVKPGSTCPWQVAGARSSPRQETTRLDPPRRGDRSLAGDAIIVPRPSRWSSPGTGVL